MRVKEIMSSNVISLKSEDTVKHALDTIIKYNINGAPVVDQNDELLGIIVKTDLYGFLISEGHYETYPVNIPMSKNVISISQDEDIKAAAEILRNNSINSVPVVDGKKVVGMLSLEDIVDYFIKNF